MRLTAIHYRYRHRHRFDCYRDSHSASLNKQQTVSGLIEIRAGDEMMHATKQFERAEAEAGEEVRARASDRDRKFSRNKTTKRKGAEKEHAMRHDSMTAPNPNM